jgi:hypothetical protein
MAKPSRSGKRVEGKPEVDVYPANRASSPATLDETLSAYTLPADSLRVEVLRSHGSYYEGQIVVLPNDERTAGLINGGFVQLVPPPILGVETYW